jgi:Tfp pilus assembly protein PilX
MRKVLPRSRLPQPQRGVVLIIALILLVVISLLAVTSVRNAGSTATVAGNVRTTELATQAAEIALRHCESSVLAVVSGTSAYATTFDASNILTANTPAVLILKVFMRCATPRQSIQCWAVWL